MSFQKLLSKSGNVFARNAVPLKKNPGQMATRSLLMYTPPTVRIPFMEKIAMGVVMAVSVMAIPTWIIYHVPEYQGENREDFKKAKFWQ